MIQVVKKHKGLGDTVEFLANITGIAYAVKKAHDMGVIEDCRCNEKKLYLNEKVPYDSRKDGKVL